MKHVSLSIYDYNRQKVCDLYDSDIMAAGQAHDILLMEEQNGWKEISFELPYDAGGEKNFRWDYIKNEYKLRVEYGDYAEFFTVQAPKKTRNGKAATTTVKCAHTSAILKTKNLYKVFDDTNGIGTARYLAGQALENTGWTLGAVDAFYERDGVNEKVRSLSSSGKRGTWQLIQDICDLFNAYPVFHDDGTNRTVDIRALSNKKPITELFIGKNLDAITVEQSSDNIITRLYVEGEYGDHGYAGIDGADANTAHLPFIMNFDYFKNSGMFTAAHQAALDRYMNGYVSGNTIVPGMPGIVAAIKSEQLAADGTENEQNILWGQCKCVIYALSGGVVTGNVILGDVAPEDQFIAVGNTVTTITTATDENNHVTHPYTVRVIDGTWGWTAADEYAIKFITKPSGRIGTQEVAIESKQQVINTLQTEWTELNTYVQAHANDATHDSTYYKKANRYQEVTARIVQLRDEDIPNIYNGTKDDQNNILTRGLYVDMREAAQKAFQLQAHRDTLAALQQEQAETEAEFAAVMGDMLRDGYWSDKNYTVGQEDELFADALERLAEVSKPAVKYTVSLVRLSEQMGFAEDVPEVNTAVRLYDETLEQNDDKAYVTKRTLSLDDPRKGSIEISNDGMIAASAKTFERMLGRVADLADMVDQRNAIYERAKALSSAGVLPAEKVHGTINMEDNGLDGGTSGWRTDADGGIIFESSLGDSAFKLCGEGFFYADSKTGDNWDWKLYGNGLGFDASALTSGLLDGSMIENGSLSYDKMSTNFDSMLNSSQTIIQYGSILQQAGLSLDENGFLVYAQSSDPDSGYLSAQFSVQAGQINSIVQLLGENGVISEANFIQRINEINQSSETKISADYITFASGQTLSQVKTNVDGSKQITDTLTGSQLWQSRTQIAALTGELEVVTDNNGQHLVIKDAAGMRVQRSDGNGGTTLAEFGTYVGDQLTAGIIVQKINGGGNYTTISGDKIAIDSTHTTTIGNAFEVDSNGRVWIKRQASFGAINGGAGSIVTINGGKVNAQEFQLNIDGSLKFSGPGQGLYRSVTYDTLGNFVTGFGTATEVGDEVRIPYYTVEHPSGSNQSAGTINFNIAATNYYITHVAAEKNSVTLTASLDDISSYPGLASGIYPSQRTYTMQLSNTQPSTQRTFTLSQDTSWDSNGQKYVYLHIDNINTQIAQILVDANGVGGSDVNVVKGSWGTGNTAGQINFTPSAGNGSISGIRLVMTGSWGSGADAYKYSYDIRDNWGHLGNGIADGISTNLTGVIDATSLVSDAIANAGQANLVWNTLEDAGSLPQSRTIYAKRSGNTEATKALYLVADGNWTNNAKYVYLCQDAQNTANGVAKIQIDAAGVYTQGANDVRITKVSAYNSSTNTLTTTFGKSMGTADNKNIAISIGTVTNSGFVYTIPVTVDGSDSSVKYYFDTEGFYNQGKADGKDEVTLTATGWSANSSYTTYTKRVYKTSGQTGNGGTYDISLSKGSTTYNNFIYSTPILDNGSATGLTVDVDGSYLYGIGVNNGRAAVTLTDPSWDGWTTTIPSTQTIYVRTSGRTDSSGTTENLTKTLSLSFEQDSSWSNNRKNVYLKAGNTRIAKTEVDASNLQANLSFSWNGGSVSNFFRVNNNGSDSGLHGVLRESGDYVVVRSTTDENTEYARLHIGRNVSYTQYESYANVFKVLVGGTDKDWIELTREGEYIKAKNSYGNQLASYGTRVTEVYHPDSVSNKNIPVKVNIGGWWIRATSRPMNETNWEMISSTSQST